MTRQVSMSQSFTGPLPPPEALANYEQASPGAADRILRMAEGQQQHRHGLERQAVSSEHRRSLLGGRCGGLGDCDVRDGCDLSDWQRLRGLGIRRSSNAVGHIGKRVCFGAIGNVRVSGKRRRRWQGVLTDRISGYFAAVFFASPCPRSHSRAGIRIEARAAITPTSRSATASVAPTAP